MPWWQVLLILAIFVFIFGFYYYFRSGAAKFIEQGKTRDKGVGAKVSKHKIMANPIFWAYIIVTLIVLAVSIYMMFVFPEGAHRGS